MSIIKRTTISVLALSVMAALTLAACGGDDSSGGDVDREEIVSSLVSSGVAQEQAECFVDELGKDAGRIFTEDDPKDLSEKDAEKMMQAIAECVEA